MKQHNSLKSEQVSSDVVRNASGLIALDELRDIALSAEKGSVAYIDDSSTYMFPRYSINDDERKIFLAD